jgi:hypothetical protein
MGGSCSGNRSRRFRNTEATGKHPPPEKSQNKGDLVRIEQAVYGSAERPVDASHSVIVK